MSVEKGDANHEPTPLEPFSQLPETPKRFVDLLPYDESMPHLILEYSTNVRETTKLGPLFSRLHTLLSETAGIDVNNCKSRARPADDYFVAEGGEREAFVHLDIRFLEGRSTEVKQAVGAQSLEVLRTWFSESDSALALQITVEIRDIDRRSYFKHPRKS